MQSVNMIVHHGLRQHCNAVMVVLLLDAATCVVITTRKLILGRLLITRSGSKSKQIDTSGSVETKATDKGLSQDDPH